ncbi:aminotransferase class III-fold pyridoxal phosphate-dependent enzyme [Streptomyces sp. ATCC 21386]|uniref:aminotransferase class III-fold pyridoxal phosphate-dependent enzyme n=1 Tax=Streptomyces sp. ATCC 21386 TaxID=2699428 RepID=UPI001BFF1E94|nr:aminotransferase class III-fold pyridoxal phosphate-dependent enzyme [Streptomyces sp. ATCC 21386]
MSHPDIRPPATEWSAETVLESLRDRFGLDGTDLEPLGGELDQNSVVRLADGRRVVVKVASPGADVAHIAWQHELMRRAGAPGRLGGVLVPTPARALNGETVVLVDGEGGPRALTVQNWLDGSTLAGLGHHSLELLAELGATAARMVAALADAPGPPTGETHHWDLVRAGSAVAAGLPAVADPTRRAAVTTLIERHAEALATQVEKLPVAVLHHDLNDFNVLARRAPDGTHHVHAVLDFADALRTTRVSELAVAVAYAMLREPDPLRAASTVVAGYATHGELTEAELAVLFPMAAARLCVNAVTWTARSAGQESGYGQARMRHTWPTIQRLAAIPVELGTAMLRAAAGRPLEPVRPPRPQVRALEHNTPDDVGGHLEPAERRRRTSATGEPETLRLGTSVDARAPFDVRLPADGVVEPGGEPALLLRHVPADGAPYWSRWHGVAPQDGALAAGASLGTATRLQVGLFPSLAAAQLAGRLVPAGELTGWAAVSPDPGPWLGLTVAHEPSRPDRVWDAAHVVAARDRHFARSQRSYYRRPMNLVSGRGSWLYDDLGRGYLDAINNVTHVGHANPRVVAAAAQQLGWLNTNSRFVYPGIAQYAERLTALLPEGLEVAFLVCSGSEANDLAIRMARQVTGRRDVLVVDGAYHGNTSVITGLSPNRYKGPGGTGPDPTTHEVVQPNLYRGEFGYDDPAAGERYAADVRRQARRLVAEGRPPAAFIAESAMGTAGSIFYPDGYLRESFAAVREAGGLCISDEVQVGFGRFGDAFWGFESQGVVPDIVTMGKPIGNGHPMAAVVTTREIADAFDSGMKYFNTFGGNPVSCAIGLAVLDEIEAEGLQHHAAETGRHFRAGLETLRRHELVGDVRSHGMYLGVELVRDRVTLEPATEEAYVVSELMKDEGVIVYPTGADNHVLKIKPPLTFTAGDADLFVSVLDEVLDRDW